MLTKFETKSARVKGENQLYCLPICFISLQAGLPKDKMISISGFITDFQLALVTFTLYFRFNMFMEHLARSYVVPTSQEEV